MINLYDQSVWSICMISLYDQFVWSVCMIHLICMFTVQFATSAFLNLFNPFIVQFFLKFRPFDIMHMMTSILGATFKGVNVSTHLIQP